MKNIEIANKWFSFFNEKNLEGLLELYAENAEHFSPKLKVLRPETGGFIKGKTELKNGGKMLLLDFLHYFIR